MQKYFWMVLVILARCFATGHSMNSGAEFLRTVIEHLNNENPALSRISSEVGKAVGRPETSSQMVMGQYKIVAPTPIPNHVDVEESNEPNKSTTGLTKPYTHPPPLSNEELMSLYQAAISKGESILNSAGKKPALATGLQELQSILSTLPAHSGTHSSIPGYYYYFYPIKQLMKQQTQPVKEKPGTVEMVPTAMMVMEDGEKRVEPLFMAVAGFIGMALMFVASVLFLPKFGTLRSRGISALKYAPDELSELTKLIMETIDGKDCNERISCEVGRAVRKMRVDNKPIRVLEILLPPALGKQLQQIRNSASKRQKCKFIPCKRKNTKDM